MPGFTLSSPTLPGRFLPAAILLAGALACGGGGGGGSAAPAVPANAPAITSTDLITPPFSPSFRLTLAGVNFLPTSAVAVNGVDMPTTFVDSAHLQVQVPSTKTASFSVQVRNPGSPALTSNAVAATVGTLADTSIPSYSPQMVAMGGPAFNLTYWGRAMEAGTVIVWNGRPLPTAVDLSASHATAQVPAADIARPGYGVAALYNPSGRTITPACLVGIPISLALGGIAADPLSGSVVVTVPGATAGDPFVLKRIDPATGAVTTLATLTIQADRLAFSTDGSYLYASATGTLHRYTWPGLAKDLEVPLGVDLSGRINHANQLLPVPGAPRSILVNMLSEGITGIATLMAYDDGVARPRAHGCSMASNGGTFGASAAQVFVFHNQSSPFVLDRLKLDSQGLTLESSATGAINGYNNGIAYAGGRIYGDDGSVVDGETLQVIKAGSGSGYALPILPDAPNNRLVVVRQETATGNTLVTFNNLATGAQIGFLSLPGTSTASMRMFRFGKRGLALVSHVYSETLSRLDLFESDLLSAFP